MTGTNSRGTKSATPAGAAATPTPSETYEQARDELAQVVMTLESGGLSLDESLTLWERGEHLARECAAFLAGARERVEVALQRAASEHPEDADDDDGGDDELADEG